jgi:2,3-dihydroxybenzoate-AMP ligase/malonyl CoA-acyl carrier protein transacylase
VTLAYLFPGQGSQQPGMGAALAAASPEAADVFARASEALGYDLLAVCRAGTAEHLRQTEVTQPAVLTTSLACLAAAAEWLPEPVAIAGHSLGEYTALVAAGALDLEDAVRLVRTRGLLMQEATRGRDLAMAAVLGLDAQTVEDLCTRPDTTGRCWAAAFNAPAQTVVSGDRAAVEALARLAEDAGGRCVLLPVSSAFHTPLMTPVAARLADALGTTLRREAAVPVVGNATASAARAPEDLHRHLVEQLDRPVRWTQTMAALRELGVRRVVELGPGRVLSGLARAFDRRTTAVSVDDPASLAAARAVLAPTTLAPDGADRADRYRRAGYWTGETLAPALLAVAAGRPPEQPALIGDSGTVTYGALAGRVAGAAHVFAAAGIGPGDRVIVHLPNSPELAVVLLALWQRGAVPVTALPAYREHELEHLAATSGAAAIAVGGWSRSRREDPLAVARRVRERQPGLATLVVVSCGDTVAELGAGEVALPGSATATEAPPVPSPPTGGSLALLLVSGGSTGMPKLVPRTHDDYLYNARISAEIGDLGTDTVYLAGLPAAHNFTLGCPGIIGTLLAGGSVVFSPRPDADAIVAAIAEHGVTATAAVPSLATAIGRYARGKGERMPSLRILQVGGARLLPDAARALLADIGPRVQQVYGMAEGLLCFTRPGDPEEVVVQTQGRPASPADELRIVGPDGGAVDPGLTGELWTRGPYTISAYHGGGGTAFTPDGWFRTGDLVRLHPTGNLVVEGRIKDVINRAGETVAAGEIELLVARHPAVAEVAAVPAGAADGGETIGVVVVVAPGHPAPSLLDLRRFLDGQRVARHKFPERLVVLQAMPRTPAGKPDKALLRRLAGAA